jgi:hypothetical protein
VARRGDEKINRAIKDRAFTLIETLLVCAFLALLAGPVILFSAHLTERFANPYSPYYIEREVLDTAEWLQTQMRRALIERRDFVFELLDYGKPDPLLRIKWVYPSETTEWRSERIAYRVKKTDSNAPTQFHHYSHRYQTMSPGFELDISAQTPDSDRTVKTEWSIIVSVYGLVRLARQEK